MGWITSPGAVGAHTDHEYLAASGLTGATAASRYVGATSGGAPASGTFAIGDFVIDRTGKIFVCITAGSPGSWAEISGTGGGGGGGGKSYITEPGLKPPDTAHADDQEFDGINGVDPTTLGLSWSGQNGATAEIRGGRLAIDLTASTTRGTHALVTATPSGVDFNITSRVTSNAITANHAVCVCFLWGTLASPTQIEIMRYNYDGRLYWTRPGVTNRQSFVLGTLRQVYLRFAWDDSAGECRAFWHLSPNGDDDWRPLGAAIDVSAGVQPDWYGVAALDETSGANLPRMLFDFMRVNWTPDFDADADL